MMSEPRREPRIEEILVARPIEQDSFGDAEEEGEERALDLKRPAIAVGGFVIAAGLIGAVSRARTGRYRGRSGCEAEGQRAVRPARGTRSAG
jgi:hypothetical protein